MAAGNAERIRFAAALGLALALVAAGCERAPEVAGEPVCRELVRSGEPVRPSSVVLIVNDTMRRDRVGAYGGPARTPAFDAFAREHLLFRQAYTQAPWTRPSIASLFTGLLPSQHGVGTERKGEEPHALPDAVVTLAEVLRGAGLRTAAFVSNPWMDERFGFQQGFDMYDDSFARWGYPGEALSEAALRWLATVPPDQPFFLYLHFLDSHRPYPPLQMDEIAANRARIDAESNLTLSDATRQEMRQLLQIEGSTPLAGLLVEPRPALVAMAYEKGIERFDRALGVFLDGFAARPGADRAVVVITSDHGEALYERGYGNHGQGLHDDELGVPLAMQLPGVTGPAGGVDCIVGLVDVLPTLCDVFGAACPPHLFGRSMLGGEGEPRFLLAEGVGGQPTHRAVRSREWKLMVEPGIPPGGPRAVPYLLYDLAADPGERNDLWASDDAGARAARERLEPLLQVQLPKPEGAAGAVVPLDPALEQRLRELGYVE